VMPVEWTAWPPPNPQTGKPDMAASSYDEALKGVLAHEGGNDDDPRDSGGRTSRGIVQSEWNAWRRNHPGLPADVWKAPQDQIKAIYRQQYWDALSCDDLPAGVDYAVFDYGVNSGIGRSAKVLQRLVGASVDGQVGPETIKAAANADASKLVNGICDERLAFLEKLGTWPTFGRGWARRVDDVRRGALAMNAAEKETS
jgi:lysozyme family protein